ncbi:MAG TPA: hypothetical protein VIF57_23290 [Polyangia bacterium]|jgi:hypothetical protein
MDEQASTHDHKALNALNEQIAAEQTRIADLERRIRVIDIEVASWKVPEPPKAPVSRGGAGWVAFLAGCTVTALLGKLIGAVIGQ